VKKYHRGFTLIELIIVITIVAILAAVALPRFIDAQKDARTAKANAIFGSIRSAAALAKARCELDLAISAPATNCKTDGSGASVVVMDGLNVNMVYGYPAAAANGIGAAAQVNPTSDGLTLNISTGAGIYYDVRGGTTTQCSISYAPATLSGTVPIAPLISVDTTAC
jgi:MSHA pilin protein MshA